MATRPSSTDSETAPETPSTNGVLTTKPRYASDPEPGENGSIAKRLDLGKLDLSLPVEERPGEALRVAHIAFAKTSSWVVFYRELLGADGVCRRLFPDAHQMRYFETTNAFLLIQEMIAGLRGQDTSKSDAAEPERMITIRIPRSLHDALRLESDDLGLSINKLCITKLLQRVDSRHVPEQRGRRRGRRAGPQKRPETHVEIKRVRKDSSGDWSEV